jgi:hypothetical protein
VSGEVWFYQNQTQSIGPYSEVQLASLFATQTLTRDTPVRIPSDHTWRPLSEVFAFARVMPPPLPDAHASSSAIAAEVVPSAQGHVAALTAKTSGEWLDVAPHPWRRYFARMFDVNLLGFFSWALIGLLYYSIDPVAAERFFQILEGRFAQVISIVTTVPLSMIWSGMFLGLSGSTPGKWLFGIRILDASGAPPGIFKGYEREVIVWVHGLGCAIPIVNMVTMLVAYGHLDKTSGARWDQNLKLAATHRPEGGVQVALGAAGIALWFAILVAVRVLK